DDERARVARCGLDATRAAALRATPLEGWLASWYDAPLFATLRAHPAYPVVLARRRQGQPAALADALEAFSPGHQPALRKPLATCPVPALLVAGALDLTYAASNDELAAANGLFQSVRVPGAGHAPHLESPDEFHAAVREWLDRP
ncbi:MAG: alpha/beta fold hydrolase, partial [Planctomycetota bacterium]|nr:alpha/beta fold hydrolase [Planctomycetota bacterium]